MNFAAWAGAGAEEAVGGMVRSLMSSILFSDEQAVKDLSKT